MALSREEIIIRMITEIMEAIVNDISGAEDLLDDARRAGLLGSILSRLDELEINLADVLPAGMAEEYFKGMTFADESLIVAGLTDRTKIRSGINNRIHIEALNALVSDGVGDLRTAIQNIRDTAPNRLESIMNDVQNSLGKSILTGENRRVASARVSEIFLKEGLTAFKVIDKNGVERNLPLDFYAKTVTKTKLRQSHNTGTENRYIENEVDLVRVDEHYPTCKECASKQGIVISLAGKTKGYPTKKQVGLPPYHPNCRHTIRPYMLEGKTDEEIERDKKKKYEPGKDNRTPAQIKAYETEQAIRRKANQEKKDYEKLKAVLGEDKMPKTLGAFRRLRRKNDLGWKQLQNDYRKAISEIDGESG